MELQMGIKADNLFLSTLPVRGATSSSWQMAAISGRFLSTLPVRGATRRHRLQGDGSFISIHAPREGSDSKIVYDCLLDANISIHAPREGSDPAAGRWRRSRGDFYPRSP